MYSCRNCCLYFKYPRLTKEQYDAFCKQGDPGHWQFQPQARRDWLLTKDILDRGCNGGKILDVGCWNEQFLEYIGNGRWEHFGIELNPVAADFARQRGLRIAATNFSQLGELDGQFDVVTAFDVIEHVENPLAFLGALGALAGCTKENGLIVVASGDTDARRWKLMGSRYWY